MFWYSRENPEAAVPAEASVQSDSEAVPTRRPPANAGHSSDFDVNDTIVSFILPGVTPIRPILLLLLLLLLLRILLHVRILLL